MDITDTFLIDFSKSLAIALAPIFILFSIIITTTLLIRQKAIKELSHVSTVRWIFVIILLFGISFLVLFTAFYMYGYVLSAETSSSLLALYLPATYFVQGIAQKLTLNLILKPKELPDTQESRNKKFGYALGATLPVAFIALLKIIDIDANSNEIYFVAPILIALPYALVYIYVKNSKK